MRAFDCTPIFSPHPVALVAGTAAFGAIGLLLATVVRTSRSAQGIGLLLFFALQRRLEAPAHRHVEAVRTT